MPKTILTSFLTKYLMVLKLKFQLKYNSFFKYTMALIILKKIYQNAMTNKQSIKIG